MRAAKPLAAAVPQSPPAIPSSPPSPDSAATPLSKIGDGFPKIHCVSQIVIPARLHSSRLPKKLLLRETGKTVLQHTFEAARRASLPEGILVAVDSEELFSEVTRFGGTAVMTDPNLPSGTDRVAVVAQQQPDIDIFVNVQGDEPEIDPEAVDLVVTLLATNPTAMIATVATPIREAAQLDNPACVKVVMDHQGRALYFSRSPIPHARSWQADMLHREPPLFWQHLGIYAYRREFLVRLGDIPPSPLEQTEQLEQLRFLQVGAEIVVGRIDAAPKGIDTPADYRAFVSRYVREQTRAVAARA
ncbi:MAG: 3-deoxy-manno-octulosonate cytidylyltransferase [Pirellulaceae bacterium]|nr:MAG: 3-deoxy-manno-octulosonate cytidylyltransferase [Pirellulaceae bacterium]